eukprot:scaffold64_cov338-Pavlova_lutheri.AAC.35
MVVIGQAVDDRDGGILSKVDEILVREEARHDQIVVSAQHPGHVLRRFSFSNPDVVGTEVQGVSTEQVEARLEGDPRSHGRFGEDHGHGHPFERLKAPVPAFDLRFDVGSALQHRRELFLAEIIQVQEVSDVVLHHGARPVRLGRARNPGPPGRPSRPAAPPARTHGPSMAPTRPVHVRRRSHSVLVAFLRRKALLSPISFGLNPSPCRDGIPVESLERNGIFIGTSGPGRLIGGSEETDRPPVGVTRSASVGFGQGVCPRKDRSRDFGVRMGHPWGRVETSPAEVTLALEVGEDLARHLLRWLHHAVRFGHFHRQLGLRRFLVRIVDAGESFDLPGTCSFVQSFGIPGFAHFQRDLHVHLDEISLGQTLAHAFPIGTIRRDEAHQRDHAGFGEQLGHLADASDVLFPIGSSESQVLIQTVADVVAVQHVGQLPAFHQGVLEGVCDRALSRSAQSSEPKHAATLVQDLLARLATHAAFVPLDVRRIAHRVRRGRRARPS